jgi:hypothetical protein
MPWTSARHKKPPLKLKNRSIIKKDGVLNAHSRGISLRTALSNKIDLASTRLLAQWSMIIW